MKPMDMYYQNYSAGGFNTPQMPIYEPQGFVQNSSYQQFGPNQMPMDTNANYDIEMRINRIENSLRSLESRVGKLESMGTITEDVNYNTNNYMI